MYSHNIYSLNYQVTYFKFGRRRRKHSLDLIYNVDFYNISGLERNETLKKHLSFNVSWRTYKDFTI